RVLGDVDRPHAAFADLAEDAVRANRGRLCHSEIVTRWSERYVTNASDPVATLDEPDPAADALVLVVETREPVELVTGLEPFDLAGGHLHGVDLAALRVRRLTAAFLAVVEVAVRRDAIDAVRLVAVRALGVARHLVREA